MPESVPRKVTSKVKITGTDGSIRLWDNMLQVQMVPSDCGILINMLFIVYVVNYMLEYDCKE